MRSAFYILKTEVGRWFTS